VTYTRRTRQINGGLNTSYLTYDGSLFSTHLASFQGYETTYSEGHSWPPREGSEIRDIGGPFLNQKHTIYSQPCELGSNLVMKHGGIIRQYHNLKIYPGGIGNKNFTPDTYRSDVPSVNQMSAYGATGIARASPVRTQLGLGQFIGELRDIPRLPHTILELRNGLKIFKSLGNQYLNYEFGWKPFLKDLRGTVKAAVNSEKHIRQLLRDNGKVVRRKVTIAKDSRITFQGSQGFAIGYPAVEGEFIDSYGKLYTSTIESNRTSFSGAFKYYLDYRHGMPMTPKLHRQLMTILYGADISPHTAWSLLPWSWLTDWFTNVGDNIANMDMIQNDSLTIVYGYATDYKQTMDQYSLQGTVLHGIPVTASQIVINEYTGRTKSTPYGFGLDPLNFTIRQAAIIAALGLSRSKPQQFR